MTIQFLKKAPSQPTPSNANQKPPKEAPALSRQPLNNHGFGHRIRHIGHEVILLQPRDILPPLFTRRQLRTNLRKHLISMRLRIMRQQPVLLVQFQLAHIIRLLHQSIMI